MSEGIHPSARVRGLASGFQPDRAWLPVHRIGAVCDGQTMLDNVKMEQVEVVLLGRVELGQVTVEQVVEALGAVEVVGMEVAGRQVDVVVGGQVMVEKPRQVGMMLGQVASPCQSSSS